MHNSYFTCKRETNKSDWLGKKKRKNKQREQQKAGSANGIVPVYIIQFFTYNAVPSSAYSGIARAHTQHTYFYYHSTSHRYSVLQIIGVLKYNLLDGQENFRQMCS